MGAVGEAWWDMIISGYKTSPLDRYYTVLYARRHRRWVKISYTSYYGDEGFPKRWFEQNRVDIEPSRVRLAARVYRNRRNVAYYYDVIEDAMTAVRIRDF